MAGRPEDDKDKDPTMEQEFNIGGWDPYLVELTRLKRDKLARKPHGPEEDRRSHKDRRKH